jgi:uncharacterized protein YndB with AHSA1/START domain
MKNISRSEKELTLTRVIDAPRDLVFKAWTDPKQLAGWWGPNGYTNPVCKFDPIPGGSIYIDMQASDGTVYPMDGTVLEIETPHRLVFSCGPLDKNGERLFEVLNAVDFTEEGGKTTITLHASVSKVMPGAASYIDGMDEGWSQSLERLMGQLPGTAPFIIERTFNAPIASVWKAITDKDDMKQWYFDLAAFSPEAGFEFQFIGGTDTKKYLHLCKVTEVIAGKKLTHSWRYDGYEGISFVTFELFAEGTKTKLILTHEGLESFPADNPDFAKGNFAEGWTHIIGKSLKEFIEKTGK